MAHTHGPPRPAGSRPRRRSDGPHTRPRRPKPRAGLYVSLGHLRTFAPLRPAPARTGVAESPVRGSPGRGRGRGGASVSAARPAPGAGRRCGGGRVPAVLRVGGLGGLRGSRPVASLLGRPHAREGGPCLSWGVTSSEGQNPKSAPDWPVRRRTNRGQDLGTAWVCVISYTGRRMGSLICVGGRKSGGSKHNLGALVPFPSNRWSAALSGGRGDGGGLGMCSCPKPALPALTDLSRPSALSPPVCQGDNEACLAWKPRWAFLLQ